MNSNVAESLWERCHLNSISTVFETTFSYYSIMAFLYNFRAFRVFVFGYRPQNKKPEITENLYFWIYNDQMHADLFFDLYFNFLRVKTEINKKNNKRLNLINLEGSLALKRQKYDTWIAMWLHHFENKVVWTVFKGFLELHSYISVFWGFSWISVISEFSFLGIGLKMKTRKLRKISLFGSTKFKCIWIYFLTTILTSWVLKLK